MKSKKLDPSVQKEDIYALNTEAVDALVEAQQGNVPQYTEEELKRYQTKSGIHMPRPLLVILMKAWFYGAVCFFILWGLGNVLHITDRIVICGIVIGMVIDLLLNNALRFFESVPGEFQNWIMVNRRGVLGLFLNVAYGLLLMCCVFGIYSLINMRPEVFFVGVEPILFGLFTMGFDLLMVGIRNLIVKLIKK